MNCPYIKISSRIFPFAEGMILNYESRISQFCKNDYHMALHTKLFKTGYDMINYHLKRDNIKDKFRMLYEIESQTIK